MSPSSSSTECRGDTGASSHTDVALDNRVVNGVVPSRPLEGVGRPACLARAQSVSMPTCLARAPSTSVLA
eukprot:236130-Chlamydomonas_euryale.AAC.1